MANEHAGEVALKIGEKHFTLKLTHNKVAEAEPFMNTSIFDALGGGIGYIRALLYVMTKDQGIGSIDAAGDLLDVDPSACMDAVNKATSLFFQKYDRGTKSKQPST